VIEVDGRACGQSPVAVPVNPGRHHVTATLANFQSATECIEFTGRSDEELRLLLNSEPSRAGSDLEEKSWETLAGDVFGIDLASPVPSSKTAADRFEGTKARQVRDDNGLKMKLVWCPPGSFTMGSPRDEKGRRCGEDQVKVTLTQGFWLGQHVVTQAQWQRVMQTTPRNSMQDFNEGDNYPATNIRWEDATKFCEKLTDQEHRARRLSASWQSWLPTEAQWDTPAALALSRRIRLATTNQSLRTMPGSTRTSGMAV
jgi:formylglycine-generating enzyme required for sulfatase activity